MFVHNNIPFPTKARFLSPLFKKKKKKKVKQDTYVPHDGDYWPIGIEEETALMGMDDNSK